MSRISTIRDKLIGIEDPEDLMIEILEVLSNTEQIPDVGGIYTFVYAPKTPNVQYDAHPLVAVSDIFQWGFRGINFHWGQSRQYTWQEVVGSLHVVNSDELQDLISIPYGKIGLNN
tara:strand:+ start:111 stop:458 length:348 start_codon:yes stop_codon:yes gene_type:complete